MLTSHPHRAHAALACAVFSFSVLSHDAAEAAERKPCGCRHLAQVEKEITEQEYLRNLFGQWADYMPGSINSTQDMRDRANALFNLTFYGAPGYAPQAGGSGAGAAFGTLVEKEGCPLVQYVYDKKGKPVLQETDDSQKKHLDPPEFEQRWFPITEAQYKSRQCYALVHYSFVHEANHKEKCKTATKEDWKKLGFYAKEDRDAYDAGLQVLYDERDRLKKQCKIKPKRDGRWRGTVLYASVFNESGTRTVKKGEDLVHPNGEGDKEWRTRKSARARGLIDAPAEGGNIKVKFDASRQESWYDKGTFIMQSECGSFRQTVWKLNHGGETRTEAQLTGAADAVLQVNDDSVSLSFRVPDMHEGTFIRHDWDKPEGYCQEHNNRQTENDDSHIQTLPGMSISIKAEIDPKHPNDIDVLRIVSESGGKGQVYYSLKLHREPRE